MRYDETNPQNIFGLVLGRTYLVNDILIREERLLRAYPNMIEILEKEVG